jgi:hypothetical protein
MGYNSSESTCSNDLVGLTVIPTDTVVYDPGHMFFISQTDHQYFMIDSLNDVVYSNSLYTGTPPPYAEANVTACDCCAPYTFLYPIGFNSTFGFNNNVTTNDIMMSSTSSTNTVPAGYIAAAVIAGTFGFAFFVVLYLYVSSTGSFGAAAVPSKDVEVVEIEVDE